MKKSPLLRSALAVILAFVLVLAAVPLPASAATTSEIKEEIADLKVENAIIQAQIDSIQSQYNANASEISALVAKKDAVDQEIALLHQQILNTNEQLIIYGQLIADAQDSLEASKDWLTELNLQYKERIRAIWLEHLHTAYGVPERIGTASHNYRTAL